ncbi:hypothetical protein BJV82DRAFT_494165, partial [Fennellomyces sp. T-0311]
CRQRLHRLLPHRFASPNCLLCGEVDTQSRFLWYCPRKHEVWQTVACRFLIIPNALIAAHTEDITTAHLAIKPESKF